MLTRKQYDLLVMIDARIRESGVPPSFEEMKEAVGLKSKSGIHRLISGLEERGFLRRLPHRARAIEILRRPENFQPRGLPADTVEQASDEGRRSGFTPTVINGGRQGPLAGAAVTALAAEAKAVQLPLCGKIAAGTPIEALQHDGIHVPVPAELIGLGEHYALTVEGDSMVDAGILDGDTVIIHRCTTAENGAIVVALVEDEEATLKRLYRRGTSIALEPANSSYAVRVYRPDQVAIQGRLVGLLRRY